MGKIKNPKLFTQEFGVDPKALAKLGLLDPILNGDTRLFIDPVLLRSSRNKVIASLGQQSFAKYFGDIIKLLEHSKQSGDLAWRNAARLFRLEELPSICLGFGGHTTRGRSIDEKTRAKILSTAKEIVDLGVRDPELFSLIGLLEPGVGPDTIGDMTAHAILPALIAITSAAAKELGIKVKDAHIDGIEARLPFNRFSEKSLLLVPTDVLRDLPVATDWSDVSDAAAKNAAIRNRVNALIGEIWKLKSKEQKDQVRAAALASAEGFKTVLDAVYLLTGDAYDFDRDEEGHGLFRQALTEFATRFPLKLVKPKSKSQTELKRIVDEIVIHFKKLIEHNGVNYITPEADSGGGPVDFKFSSGYDGRVLVEIKLSTGKVVHGYSTQLGVYEKAEQSFNSIFLIVDVGGLDEKLKTILERKNKQCAKKVRVPDIVVVDAKRKPSASRR